MITNSSARTNYDTNTITCDLEFSGEDFHQIHNAWYSWSKAVPSPTNFLDFVEYCLKKGVSEQKMSEKVVKIDGFPSFSYNFPRKDEFSQENTQKNEENQYSDKKDEDAAARYYIGRLNAFFDYDYSASLDQWLIDDLAALVGEVCRE